MKYWYRLSLFGEYFIFACLFAFSNVFALQHPFLIVTDTMYAGLQARAVNSPWNAMKTAAINDAANLSYSNPSSIDSKTSQMYNAVSAGALAYILNPSLRSTYVQKLVPILKGGWANIYADIQQNYGSQSSGYGLWNYTVPVGAAFFNSVLCLDIIYNDITAAERDSIEAKLKIIADWFRFGSAGGINPPSPQGALGVWYLYKGDSLNTLFYAIGYKAALLDFFTNDGIFMDGPHYAYDRLSGAWQRDAKAHFLDVLEFTGKDRSFYSNTKIQNFYEWLYGYAVSPFGRFVGFCDADPFATFTQASSNMGRIYRFSAQTAKYAAWKNAGAAFPGRLLHYVLMAQQLPAAAKPKSKIFSQGFAGFCENNQNSLSLMGALWSCNETRNQHTHKEANAICLAAYGEQVLLNAGYAGYNHPSLTFSWNDIHANPLYANTVMIKVLDHKTVVGGGIAEGFCDSLFNYASGFSDTAIAAGRHWRNFCFVHPQDGKSGYFLLFDEVAENAPYGSKIYLALHPNADNLTALTAGKEYYAKIAPRTFIGHDVFLSIFHGTLPDSIGIRDGIHASNSGSVASKFLHSVFMPNASGKKNMVTVLFPYDATHPKPAMTNITGANFSGASVDLGGSTVDIALESFGTDVLTYQGITFKGMAVFFRKNNGVTGNYFIRKGTCFSDNTNPALGFLSDKEISVHIKSNTGAIVSTGATVTFNYPNLASVLLNGVPAQITGTGTNTLTVVVPAGTYSLQLSNVLVSVRELRRTSSAAPCYSSMFSKNGEALFTFFPHASAQYELRIYDVNGRLVYSTKNEELRMNNENPVLWNGTDNWGRKAANGNYFVKIGPRQGQTEARINVNR